MWLDNRAFDASVAVINALDMLRNGLVGLG